MMDKSKKKRESESTLVVVLGFIFFLTLIGTAFATPTGPDSLTVVSNETKAATAGALINISGGYLSKINITANTQNPHWKAFAGWVNGQFTLDDASGSTIYDWTLSTVTGEVYATRNSSTPVWTSIQCATAAHIQAEDLALQHSNPDDNITATFSGTNSDTFVTAGTTITAGSCSSTNTYVNNVSQSSTFEESILYDTNNLIYAAVLESDATGYDGNTYDFQMLVPENGNATLSVTTAYYVYLELG